MRTATVTLIIPGPLDTLTGGYIYDRRLLEELRLRGLDVDVVCLSGSWPFPGSGALQAAGAALAALDDDALVIIDGLAYGAFDEEVHAHARRLRVIALCHHPLALESGLDPRQQRHLMMSETRGLHLARAVIVTSEHTRQTLLEHFALAADRILVARPGTDPQTFSRCDGRPPRLLTLASLTRRKGHDILIEALARLENLPWQARFVGGADFDRAWSDDLRRRVDRLQLQARIHFVGTVDDTRREFENADVFVLPSRYEGYGMVFAEALAAGLPVVAARTGAVPDVVPEAAGLLVPAEDIGSLGTALHSLLTCGNLRRRLQAGARQAASELPTWADSADRVARLIKEVQYS